jgi:hypothetical protein
MKLTSDRATSKRAWALSLKLSDIALLLGTLLNSWESEKREKG